MTPAEWPARRAELKQDLEWVRDHAPDNERLQQLIDAEIARGNLEMYLAKIRTTA
jgi:hypothetical protein